MILKIFTSSLGSIIVSAVCFCVALGSVVTLFARPAHAFSPCRGGTAEGVAAGLLPTRDHHHHHHHHHGRFSTTALHSTSPFKVSGMWNNGLSYGKGPFRFYKNFDSWMSPFPQQDRDMYPEIFTFPKGVYEISMVKPLGIIFEEIQVGKGVYVVDLVEGGNAERMGTIQRGDVLVGITAVKVIGAKWERRLIPAKDLSFDTVVGAIGSNDEKWSCEDVVLWFMRPEEVEDVSKVDDFLMFFNPPGDSAWRTA
mmetsp:Transcript_2726/g.5086  ORF Transcript_2726/g.5086 Transcript_2726/m.5086 type:complete len:253 (-) Transcript_2726:181-939(-)